MLSLQSYFFNKTITDWISVDYFSLLILILLISYLLWIYLFLYRKSHFGRELKLDSKSIPGISVVVAARNEAENLKRLIPELLKQDYPCFELIVVNDRSSDQTERVIKQFQDSDARIRYSATPQEEFSGMFFGKKLALSIGIKTASYENLLFIDADCLPSSEQWISKVAPQFEEANMLVMLGMYQQTGGFLNQMQCFESFRIALNAGAFTSRNRAFMSVGRNFAYRKSVFYQLNGFSQHIQLRSGDDDLFLQDYQNQNNSRIKTFYQAEAKTISIAESTFRDWFNQKRRHVSTAARYPKTILFRLFINDLSHLFFFFGSPFLFYFSPLNLACSSFIYGIVLAIILWRWRQLSKAWKEKISLILLPFNFLCVALFQAAVSLSVWKNQPKNWTGN